MAVSKSVDLRDTVFSYLSSDEIALNLFERLESHNELILLGGAVRDYIVYSHFAPRDIDIVLIGSNDVLINMKNDIFLQDRVFMNNFGGFKIFSKNCVFDIWHINDTWAFKKKLIVPCVENLLNTVFLNIDAYAYNLTKRIYLDECNKREFPKEIDVVLIENPNLPLNVMRALILSRKYNINLSDRIKAIIKQEIDKSGKKEDFISALLMEQQRHYNEKSISFSEIDQLLTEL